MKDQGRSIASITGLLMGGALILLLVNLGLEVDLAPRALAHRLAHPLGGKTTLPSPAAAPTVSASSWALAATPSSFHEEFVQMSEAISRPVGDPQALDREMTQRARQMGPDEILELRQVLFNERQGDQIALALDLLGRSDLPEAQAALVDYSLKGSATATPEQSTFQMMALEGVMEQTQRSKDPTALAKIRNETGDALMSRRAEQALGAMKGKNPWPEQTDGSALKKLLQDEHP